MGGLNDQMGGLSDQMSGLKDQMNGLKDQMGHGFENIISTIKDEAAIRAARKFKEKFTLLTQTYGFLVEDVIILAEEGNRGLSRFPRTTLTRLNCVPMNSTPGPMRICLTPTKQR